MPKIDDSLKADVVKWSSFYEHRIRIGSVCLEHKSRVEFDLPSNSLVESNLPPRSIRGKVHAVI